MKRVPEIFGSFWANYAYVFGLTLFYFFFVPVFKPFDMTLDLDMGRGLFFLNTALMTCIILGTLVITRLTFYLLFKYLGRNWWAYASICVLEMVMITYFLALYLFLMDKGSGIVYFSYVAYCLQYSFLILLFPSIFHLLICLIICKMDKPEVQSPSIVRFTDKYKQIKFAVSRDAILYISAEENYIRIHYADDSGVKDYLLRSSMSAISALVTKHGLCRCHRSYYVNPAHIKALVKDKFGQISAEIGSSGITIPVSRMYYPEVSKRI